MTLPNRVPNSFDIDINPAGLPIVRVQIRDD